VKVGDLVKRRVRKSWHVGQNYTTIYVITEVYRSSVYNNAYTLFTISQASKSLRAYEKDLILLEDAL
jgi:hypothetical protein